MPEFFLGQSGIAVQIILDLSDNLGVTMALFPDSQGMQGRYNT